MLYNPEFRGRCHYVSASFLLDSQRKTQNEGSWKQERHIFVIKLETSQLTFVIIMTMNSAHVHSGHKKVTVVHHAPVVLPPSVVSLVVGCCTICPLSQRLRDPNSLQQCGETTV